MENNAITFLSTRITPIMRARQRSQNDQSPGVFLCIFRNNTYLLAELNAALNLSEKNKRYIEHRQTSDER